MSANESSDCPPKKKAKLDEHVENRDQVVVKYLYETFKQGVDSDIKVIVLEKKWKLHKFIIRQCPYFASMFSGNWTEFNQDVIDITIEDLNITSESVEIVFGSMYGGNILFTSDNVVSILATASLFQIQDLIEKCLKFIIADALDAKTAINYYNVAEIYKLPEIKANVKAWLELNLRKSSISDHLALQNISVELMKDVISSPNFHHGPYESSIYQMLRKWLYLQLKKSDVQLEEFYDTRTWKTSLLLTKRGESYKPVFEAMRIKYILNHAATMQMVENDLIVPREWSQSAYKDFCQDYLRISSNEDLGPTIVSDDAFEKECLKTCWDFKECIINRECHFGDERLYSLDFEIAFRETGLKIIRKRRDDKQCIGVPKTERNIMLKVSLANSDGKTRTRIVQSSELLTFSLKLNEEKHIMNYSEDLKYPITMMAKILTVTPQ